LIFDFIDLDPRGSARCGGMTALVTACGRSSGGRLFVHQQGGMGLVNDLSDGDYK